MVMRKSNYRTCTDRYNIIPTCRSSSHRIMLTVRVRTCITCTCTFTGRYFCSVMYRNYMYQYAKAISTSSARTSSLRRNRREQLQNRFFDCQAPMKRNWTGTLSPSSIELTSCTLTASPLPVRSSPIKPENFWCHTDLLATLHVHYVVRAPHMLCSS